MSGIVGHITLAIVWVIMSELLKVFMPTTVPSTANTRYDHLQESHYYKIVFIRNEIGLWQVMNQLCKFRFRIRVCHYHCSLYLVAL